MNEIYSICRDLQRDWPGLQDRGFQNNKRGRFDADRSPATGPPGDLPPGFGGPFGGHGGSPGRNIPLSARFDPRHGPTGDFNLLVCKIGVDI